MIVFVRSLLEKIQVGLNFFFRSVYIYNKPLVKVKNILTALAYLFFPNFDLNNIV